MTTFTYKQVHLHLVSETNWDGQDALIIGPTLLLYLDSRFECWDSLQGQIPPVGHNTLSDGFLGGPSGKEPTCQCRRYKRHRFNPWVGKEGHGNPLQYSCLENHMDRGIWQATVHGIAQSQTWLKQISSSSRYSHTIESAISILPHASLLT